MKIALLIFAILFSQNCLGNEPKQDKQRVNSRSGKQINSSQILGMNVTGNKESPRSLTIVPWRSPLMDGQSPEIAPYWQPALGLLEPESYRRDINLFLHHRKQK